MEELAKVDIENYEMYKKNPGIKYNQKVTIKSLNFFLDGIRMSKLHRTEVWVMKALTD